MYVPCPRAHVPPTPHLFASCLRHSPIPYEDPQLYHSTRRGTVACTEQFDYSDIIVLEYDCVARLSLQGKDCQFCTLAFHRRRGRGQNVMSLAHEAP